MHTSNWDDCIIIICINVCIFMNVFMYFCVNMHMYLLRMHFYVFIRCVNAYLFLFLQPESDNRTV